MRTIQTILNTTDADVIMPARLYIGFNWLSTVPISTTMHGILNCTDPGNLKGLCIEGRNALRVTREADTRLKTW